MQKFIILFLGALVFTSSAQAAGDDSAKIAIILKRLQTLEAESRIKPETVVAIYSKNTSTTLAGKSSTIVPFNIKEKDTHAAYSATGVFTAPVSGTYLVNMHILQWTSVSGKYYEAIIYKNDVLYAIVDQRKGSADNGELTLNGGRAVPLLAGETIDIRVRNHEPTSHTVYTGSTYNGLSIVRIGN